MSCALGLVQGGGEGVPAGFVAYRFGLVGHGGFESAGVPLSYGFGEASTVLAHRVHGGSCGRSVGAAQVLCGSLAGGWLLGVAAGGVPARGGDGDEDHRGGAAVFVFTGGVAGADDAANCGANSPVVGALGADVGAGGAFEGAGGLDEFLAGRGRGGLRDGIEEFADADELGGRVFVVVLVDDQCRSFGGRDCLAPGAGREKYSFVTMVGDGFVVGASGVEALADPGEGEVRGEFGAGEPDGFAVAVAVAGEGDLVSEGVARWCDAPFDPQAGLGEAVEELFLAGGSGQGVADALPQGLAGCLAPAGSFGLGAFGAGGALGGGAVAAVEDLQAELLLDLAAFGLGADAVFMAAGAASVFALEGGDEVDVVVGVVYGDPPAGLVVAVFGDAGGVDDAAGDFGPLGVGEVAVAGGGTDPAVPEVPGRSPVLRKGEDGEVESVVSCLRVADGSRPGSGASSDIQAATRCGSVCSSRRPGP